MEVSNINDYWYSVKEIIDKVCKNYDALWQKRHRVLTSKLILIVILKLASNNRRQGLTTNLAELWDDCLTKNIALPQVKSIAASSFCEARQKLSEDIFKKLNKYCKIGRINVLCHDG